MPFEVRHWKREAKGGIKVEVKARLFVLWRFLTGCRRGQIAAARPKQRLQ